jgi:magnesium-transporting ATPase (P-type)
MSYSLSILLIVPVIFGFPLLFEKNLLLAIVLLKQFLNIYLIPNMERDYDVLRRRPRTIEDKIFTGQEIIFNILSIIAIVIGASVIYMSTLTVGANQNLSMSLVLNIYLYSYIFIILVNLSESLTIINIFKSLKDLCTLTIILLLIAASFAVWYLPLLSVSKLNLMNYRSCIIVALITTIWFDITKIARYFRRKKVKNA